MKQLAFDFAVLPAATLDNFISGRNAELLHNLRRLAAARDGERLIYAWGATGSDRTHLLKGVVAAAQSAASRSVYVPCANDTRLPEDLLCYDCVAIDDVEHLDDVAQIAMFNLCNAMREQGGALLVSGNVPPARLLLRQDLITRLAWGLVYEVYPLTDDEKAQALRRRAAERGFLLADEVCAYLMTRVPREMSVLLGILDALDRYSLQAKRPVTVALARELLQANARHPRGAAEPGATA